MKKKIYPKSSHNINPDRFDPDALYVVSKLQQAGFEAYLVGGCVRDILLNVHPKDFDISTNAKPSEIRSLFRNAFLIGRRFQLAHIRFGAKTFEVSTFRAGNPDANALIVDDNEWGNAEEDALRRDFTINGLFYDPAKEEIIDYVNGMADIEKRLLRVIGKPHLRFRQDPVRMIRLLKFVARFHLDVEDSALVALYECRADIAKSSQARVFEEILRMLESGASESFFSLMTEHGFLKLMIPQLAHFYEQPEGRESFTFLMEVDAIHKNPERESKPPIHRGVLLSCLIYPYLKAHLEKVFHNETVVPHLGEIQELMDNLIFHLFSPFFLLPRKLKQTLFTILSNQFRLTPFNAPIPKKIRIPKNSQFHLALQFLELRSLIEPPLVTIFEKWTKSYAKYLELHPNAEEEEEDNSYDAPSRPRRFRHKKPRSFDRPDQRRYHRDD